MFNPFGTKKTEKELARQGKREIQKSTRNLAREREKLKLQEKQIQSEIKAALKRGDEYTARVLAKQVIKNRQQQQKMLKMGGQMTALQHRTTVMDANQSLAKAMSSTANVMTAMNKQMDTQKMNAVLRNFQKESQKMDMMEEMIDDNLDNIFDSDDIDEDIEQAMGEVLDEIGLDLGNKLGEIKTGTTKVKVKPKMELDDEIDDDLLKKLSSLKDS